MVVKFDIIQIRIFNEKNTAIKSLFFCIFIKGFTCVFHISKGSVGGKFWETLIFIIANSENRPTPALDKSDHLHW